MSVTTPTPADLDVGVLEHLLDAVDRRRALIDQARPRAGQIAQFTLRPAGDEAGLEHPVFEERRDPLSVAHVGFAAGHGVHVRRVDHQDRAVPIQNVVDRFPETARRLQRHAGATRRQQPGAQALQRRCRRVEGLNLLALRAAISAQQTRHHRLLVDV